MSATLVLMSMFMLVHSDYYTSSGYDDNDSIDDAIGAAVTLTGIEVIQTQGLFFLDAPKILLIHTKK